MPLLFGCGAPPEPDLRFVGKWQSELPVSGGLWGGETALQREISRKSLASIRQANAEQSQYLGIELHADGTFSMHFKMDHRPLEELIEQLVLKEDDGTPLELPTEHLFFEGDWSCDSDTVSLRAKSMFPFAHQEYVRRSKQMWRLRGRRPYVLRGWRLVLHLHQDAHLRSVRDGAHLFHKDAVLDFGRLPD